MLAAALAEHAIGGAAVAAAPLGAKLDDASVALGAALLGRAALEPPVPPPSPPAAPSPPAPPATADDAAAAPASDSGDGGEESDAAAPAEAASADAEPAATEAATPAEASPPAPAVSFAGRLGADELAALVSAEAALAVTDAAAARVSAVRNEIESFVYEARNLRGQKHGALIDGGALEPLLDGAEEWLYSDESAAASVEALGAKCAELRAAVDAVCTAFHAAVAADRAKDEAELEAAAAAAAAERAAAGDDDDDHDTRRLKFPDRMRMVLKNKEEGTELFGGQNYRPAAARYNKALTHAAKFHDLSPEQTAEVTATKLSLHLNVAMCWLKIADAPNRLEQTINSCEQALKLDPDCVKALYRRATALEEKRDFDAAKADLTRAAKISPEDKMVPKLMARVDAQLKRAAAKEKKMWGKAFS